MALDHRIDAVLSQDAGPAPATYLLSTEDQVGRVYRYDGPGTEALAAEFPLGTLRFIGEINLAGSGSCCSRGRCSPGNR